MAEDFAEKVAFLLSDPQFRRVLDVLEPISKSLEIVNRLAVIGLDSLGESTGEPERIEEADPFIGPTEVAKLTGYSWRTFRDNWIKRHGIETVGTGKARRVRRSEVLRAMREREAEARGENGVAVQNRGPVGD